jgi:hypothetical protein
VSELLDANPKTFLTLSIILLKIDINVKKLNFFVLNNWKLLEHYELNGRKIDFLKHSSFFLITPLVSF